MDSSGYAFSLKLRTLQQTSKQVGRLHAVQLCCGALMLALAVTAGLPSKHGLNDHKLLFLHGALLIVCAIAIVANGIIIRLIMKVLENVVSVDSAPRE